MNQMGTQQQAPLFSRQADEVPTNRFLGDLFEREALAERLSGLLESLPNGAVIAIDAPWGEGKSWFARRWHAVLEDKGFRSVLIDCFQQDYVGDPFALFAGEFLTLAKKGKPEVRTKLLEAGKKVGASLLPAAAKLAVNTLGHLAVGNSALGDDIAQAIKKADEKGAEQLEKLVAKALEEHETNKKSVQGFRAALANLAAEAEKPVVIFVDELDRCRPDFAVHAVERIKHFFDVPGIIFVLLVNRKQLAASVRGVYGDGVDAEAYLAKFVHLSLTLPKRLSLERGKPNDNTRFVSAELQRYGFQRDTTSENFSSALGLCASLLNMSLRDLERAIPLFSFASPKGQHATFAAWPIALKIARPELYDGILANKSNAHGEAARMCDEFRAHSDLARHLFGFFGGLHKCAATGFKTPLEEQVPVILMQLSPGVEPSHYCFSVFDQVNLTIGR
ncbi:P-loop NTPase fold protein [Pelomonas sp. APW6]|uniref:P-loop NTPase fold protein n=1 Tax=Roseateles subflavus TaxID=3053353 RepID=A0ABT7LP97_9BURK|nr:P-loop NTPase fold protein [Pelomonas sp. APW6]MDL5033326.1 P-loop NTPase fold protein [Pelomonas sp. APW6]